MVKRFFLIVGDHHRRQAELALQGADLDAHFQAQLGIQVGQRFVEQQHVGSDHDRAGQRDPLLLAARQLARQAVGQMVEPHQTQRFVDPRGDRSAAILRISRPKPTLSRTRHVREQRVVLEHEAGIALPGRQVA